MAQRRLYSTSAEIYKAVQHIPNLSAAELMMIVEGVVLTENSVNPYFRNIFKPQLVRYYTTKNFMERLEFLRNRDYIHRWKSKGPDGKFVYRYYINSSNIPKL